MRNWSWKEGFTFAVAAKLMSVEGAEVVYQRHLSEKFGSHILKPLYKLIEFISKHMRIPLAICLFTLVAALILSFIFYDISLAMIFGKWLPIWLIRLLFFIYVELNVVAIGSVAFGRFNNQALVELWKNGQLVASMPGDVPRS